MIPEKYIPLMLLCMFAAVVYMFSIVLARAEPMVVSAVLCPTAEDVVTVVKDYNQNGEFEHVIEKSECVIADNVLVDGVEKLDDTKYPVPEGLVVIYKVQILGIKGKMLSMPFTAYSPVLVERSQRS